MKWNFIEYVIKPALSLIFLIGSAQAMELHSNAFKPNDYIPSVYTCDSRDISPPLHWTGAPAQTKSFALIVDDPDAPMGTWDHWILFNIALNQTSLAEGITPSQFGVTGKNSFGNQNYGGPCPPSGVHHYHFKLYALDTMLNLSAGSSKREVEKAMQGHILAQAELIGLYKRQ